MKPKRQNTAQDYHRTMGMVFLISIIIVVVMLFTISIPAAAGGVLAWLGGALTMSAYHSKKETSA